jgi:XTP/dITP diphosphohydrolase
VAGDRGALIVLATRNEGKKAELLPLLAPLGARILTLDEAGVEFSPDEDAIESHATFEENAAAKARWFNQMSGLPCIADDSGLAVDALGGEPGVRSRRWSGEQREPGRQDAANNALLIESLRAADAAGVRGRGARYVCVAAYADGARELMRRGETLGFIIDEPRGSGGFGYDPYFWSPELGCTFGEATLEQKASVSHRGRAVRALCTALGS